MYLTPYAAKTEFCLWTQNSPLCQFDHPWLFCLNYITLGVDYSSVCMSERLENFIMILEKHLESDERSFEENVWTWGVCKSTKRGLLNQYCLRLFVFGYPCTEGENMILQCLKSYRIR